MESMHIQVPTDDRFDEAIREGLFAYNQRQAPTLQPFYSLPLRLVLMDDDSKVYGGMLGKAYRGCLFIDILWIEETCRGAGYGKALLESAEAFAREAKCTFIHLDTFSFQAPDFYLANGFETFGILNGYEDDVKRYFLKKTL
ncbi:GNAT family N-acetyltransferase [Fusibacter paucivorans]|uniref:GNAT family N-acetyltransferase n=1 Tax=Fusibacter paucivorans TaxID=76009 RepID=A0ABS5PL87_9FIRM|nr:GNAT family N-acetyltransferase [Fusibacter paucivorans]MBS7525938.1 GNAT family N-acetyltransferase [Fusibacter paucivorans]